ncbi:MAG: hypothetical protein WC868_03145 [Bacteroidales bacterium]
MRKNKKLILQSLIIFFSVVILTFFGSKFIGEISYYQLTPSHPLSWHEAINQIPNNLIFSAIIGVLGYYILWSKKKQEEKQEEMK